jgi:hypothetical protein
MQRRWSSKLTPRRTTWGQLVLLARMRSPEEFSLLVEVDRKFVADCPRARF